jgi:hypothetical protein
MDSPDPSKNPDHPVPNQQHGNKETKRSKIRSAKANQKKAASAAAHAKKPKRPTKHFVRISNLVIQGLLLAVGVGYSLFAYWQWKYMGVQLTLQAAANYQAAVAQTVFETNARLDQRAWVAPVELSVVYIPESGKPIDTKIVFKNAGKTFAKKVTLKIFQEGHPSDDPPRNPCEGIENRYTGEQGSISILSPGAEYPSHTRSDNLTDEQLANLQSGKLLYHIYGRIAYEDIFGCPHWTNFASTLNVLSWNYEADHDCNDADDNVCR